MTSFPAPLVPTAQLRPILPHPFRVTPDGRCGWFVEHPAGRVGNAFPRVVQDLDGDWFGKRRGRQAEPFPGEAQALAYVAGCDPAGIWFEEAS